MSVAAPCASCFSFPWLRIYYSGGANKPETRADLQDLRELRILFYNKCNGFRSCDPFAFTPPTSKNTDFNSFLVLLRKHNMKSKKENTRVARRENPGEPLLHSLTFIFGMFCFLNAVWGGMFKWIIIQARVEEGFHFEEKRNGFKSRIKSVVSETMLLCQVPNRQTDKHTRVWERPHVDEGREDDTLV